MLSTQKTLEIRHVESAPAKAVQTDSHFVGKDGRDLILHGKPFKSVGVNRYNLLTLGGDPYVGCAGVFTDEDLASWFSELEGMGVTSIRFWVFQSFTRGGTDLSRFDYVLEQAREKGIKVIPVLENQWADCTEGGFKPAEWYRVGYKSPYGAYTLSYRDYVARIVEKYRNESTIMLWQLINEAETDHNILYSFTDDMAGLIKSIDRNHLVSLGTIGSGQKGAQYTEYRVLHAIPTIDIVEYHDYHSENLPFPNFDNFNSLATRFSDAVTLDKPIIMGESGIKSNCARGDCYGQAERAALFQGKMNEFFSRGGAAYLLWSYRDHWQAPIGEFDFTPTDPLSGVLRAQTSQL